MTNSVVLNNIDHQDLRVISKKSPDFGDNVNGVLVYPIEFIHAHKEYPIYFQKSSETGEFQAVALFGFAQGENFFLDDTGWLGRYEPALLRREPFLIGMQKDTALNNEIKPVLMIDLDSPRISKNPNQGTPVFKENGGNSAYLDEINQALSLIHEGQAASKFMFEQFMRLELIEPFVLDIAFKNNTQFKTDMFYTINQEKLINLPDQDILALHKSGLLQIANMVLESMSNIRYLINKRDASS